MDREPRVVPEAVVSRRTALRGAAAGASLVWVVPLVQVVSMEGASAASGPAPKSKTKPQPKTKPAQSKTKGRAGNR
jgi:hypothetical protein